MKDIRIGYDLILGVLSSQNPNLGVLSSQNPNLGVLSSQNPKLCKNLTTEYVEKLISNCDESMIPTSYHRYLIFKEACKSGLLGVAKLL